ncbi:MAG: phytoene desaturase [Chloroflexota bacterium]|nr:phytoene desaturase [Chloroflexota bacterium]
MRAIVIGSGFGGIAAAVRLAARGHEVTLLEQRDQPGGRAYVYRQDGFSFDGGPTVITAPWLLEELYTLAGERMQDHIELVPVTPFYRIFFHDGEHFDYTGDPDAMDAEIRRLTGSDRDVAGYRRFLAMSERIFNKGFTELADQPFLRLTDMLKVAPDLMRLQSYRTVYSLVSQFVEEERLRQVLTFHPLLIGGNPFETTSIYSLIQHLESRWGVWFAMGGTGAIIDELVALLGRLGGTLRCNARVTRIHTANGRATSVRLEDGTDLHADVVVCNAEVVQAYRSLVPEWERPSMPNRKLERLKQSMSLVVIYFGTDRLYRGEDGPELAHHNIILGPRYKELLEDIFDRKVLADDFSLYLHMPTLTDPSLAPEGHEGFYVLAPVPHLGGTVDWAKMAMPYRDRIMAFLEERYLPGLSAHIVTEHMIDPRHFATMLSSWLGAGFSVEPILTQSAWFRPHNRADDIANLYFVGAGTHPGAGVPGVLTSAKIADDLIAAALK